METGETKSVEDETGRSLKAANELLIILVVKMKVKFRIVLVFKVSIGLVNINRLFLNAI